MNSQFIINLKLVAKIVQTRPMIKRLSYSFDVNNEDRNRYQSARRTFENFNYNSLIVYTRRRE